MSISTSQAVKAVVNEIKSRFSSYPLLFEAFYDIDRAFEPQFQQYYAKTLDALKLKQWIALMYSYDPAERNTLQNRLFTYKKSFDGSSFHIFDCAYASTSLMFSMVTNDGDLYDAFAEDLRMSVNWDFTTTYSDIMWPTRENETEYKLGAIIRPTSYNNKVYTCTTAGTSSTVEPTWTTTVGDTYTDGTVVWTCTVPDQMKVRAYDWKVSSAAQDVPQTGGIRYKFDFGCTLMLTILRDNNRVLPPVLYSVMDVLTYTDAEQISIHGDGIKNIDSVTATIHIA